MSLWRQVTRGLRGVFREEAAHRDTADEVAHYMDEATAELRARGMSSADARRAALIEAGNPTAVREQVHASGWEHVVTEFFTDLRYGLRRLARNPGFAALSILTLALGIGASTAIFSAVNPILFRPLPYRDPGRIVSIADKGTGATRIDVTFASFRELVTRSRSFDAMAVTKPWQPVLTGQTEPERLEGQRVSAGYFKVLGVGPVLGRDFDAAEDQVNGPAVVIISDGLWRRRFGADPRILERPITLNGNGYTVVGVMPPGFENVMAPDAVAWAPLQYDASLPAEGREWGHHLRMLARIRAGLGMNEAARDLEGITANPVPEFVRMPWALMSAGVFTNALQDDVIRAVKPALLAVLGAVLLLLGIACVNVTSMLLARGAKRQGEFVMRAALGAPRLRLVRQLLTESLLLAVIGGLLGLFVAEAGVRAFVALSPPGLPRAGAIEVNASAFVFALGLSTLTGLLAGLVPALYAGRADPRLGPSQASRSTTAGHQTARRALVVAEVALALMLLTGAGLLLRSLQRLFSVAPGFDSSNLLTMQVFAAGNRFDDPAQLQQFFGRAADAVREVPGVESAAFTSQLPLSGDFDKYGVQWEANPEIAPDEDESVFRYAVSTGWFDAMRIPLRSGRFLDERDEIGPPTVVINESLARRRFPGGDPIGQRLHMGDTNQPWYTVVGVVGEVKQASLAVDGGDAIYIAAPQWYAPDRVRSLVVRTRSDPTQLFRQVQDAIWSVDKDQPVVRVATMSQLVATSAAERRFALILFEAFAVVALVLAGIGIYGVLSGSVAERTREIGVRTALGASRSGILSLILRQGLSLTGVGVVLGLAGAFAATRVIETLLFGVSRLDPVTYAGVVVLLAGTALVACWLPARRASQVDPVITLRAE
jgi:putative ABC transport system permease protein